ncbi:MAG: amidohydrolase family protein [Planctomycetes bacterium]|nr:amidohydrolase family protein [Planctomycetota bacterium]
MKTTITKSWIYAALILGLGFSTLSTATAASVGFRGDEPKAESKKDDDKKKDKEDDDEAEEEEEDKTRWHAIVGGDIYTGTGAVLKNATLLSKDGVIVELGYDVWIPEEAEVLDATGFRVYPGVVAIASTGLFGGGSDLANSVDPYSQGMMLGLASGITSAVQGSEIAKLKRGFIDDLVMGSNFFQTMRYRSSTPSGKKELRKKLDEASAYLRTLRAWRADRSKDKGKEPKASGIDLGLVSVLAGEKKALFREDSRSGLLDIARLSVRYGFRPVIQGGREAWTVADELGRAGATVILTPRDRRAKDQTLVREGGTSIENAKILHASGVQVAIRSIGTGNSTMSGIAGRDVIHLPISASFAMRGGLSEQAALAAITIVPARLTGVDHRIGSLEVGKDADCIITDGNILNYATFVQWAVVDGAMVYDKQAEMYYAHIRPRPEAQLAPEAKVDAGEEVEEVEEEGDAGEGEPEAEESEEGEEPEVKESKEGEEPEKEEASEDKKDQPKED